MEINLENKRIDVCKELSYQSKIIQEQCESVVPDTDDDIGKLAALQSHVLLKSKDITGRGVLVTGELAASLMYISETQDKTSFIKLKKGFSIEFEVADIRPDAVAQVNLTVLSAEARLINPRKVSVCFEINADMNCYIQEEMSVEYGLPAECSQGIHAKYESLDLNITSAVCEKTFSLNEQFTFPSGKPKPSKLVFANADLTTTDIQLIGTKAIAKGSANISLVYFSDDASYPIKTEFSTMFSQIIDMGEETVDNCTLIPSITGIYYNIADSISGDKLIEIELHAVLQLVCRSKRQMVYVSDAYSNLMPYECKTEKNLINYVSNNAIKINADERLNISDCSDVLSIFTSLPRIHDSDKTQAVINVDIIYKDKSGLLSTARRNITVQTEIPDENFRINSSRIIDLYLRPDGENIDCHFALELTYTSCVAREIKRLSSISLFDNEIMDMEKLPSLTIVRCCGESVWELAKKYHSSVERISEYNDLEDGIDGKMILVPKCI